MIKVAMIADHPSDLDAPSGGVQAVVAALSPYLAAQVELHIIYPRRNPACRGSRVVETIARGQLVRYVVHGTRAFPVTGLSYFTLNRRALFTYIRREISPDLVHVQGPAGHVAACGYPTVLTIHGLAEKEVLHHGCFGGLKSQLIRKVEVCGRRSADRIIAISPAVMSVDGVDAAKAVMIPNPIVDAFFNVSRSAQSGRILWAGKITPLKNPELALRLVAAIPAVRLCIAGSGDVAYVNRLKFLAEKLGIANRVDWLGELNRTGLLDQMSLADVLLMTSRQENAPMIIAEAMAAGVPVIATDVGNIAEMTAGSQCVVPLDRQADLDYALRTVLGDTKLRSEMSAAGQRIARSFSCADVADKTVSVYRNLLSI